MKKVTKIELKEISLYLSGLAGKELDIYIRPSIAFMVVHVTRNNKSIGPTSLTD